MADIDLVTITKWGEAIAKAAAVFSHATEGKVPLELAIDKFTAAVAPAMPRKADGSKFSDQDVLATALRARTAANNVLAKLRNS